MVHSDIPGVDGLKVVCNDPFKSVCILEGDLELKYEDITNTTFGERHGNESLVQASIGTETNESARHAKRKTSDGDTKKKQGTTKNKKAKTPDKIGIRVIDTVHGLCKTSIDSSIAPVLSAPSQDKTHVCDLTTTQEGNRCETAYVTREDMHKYVTAVESRLVGMIHDLERRQGTSMQTLQTINSSIKLDEFQTVTLG